MDYITTAQARALYEDSTTQNLQIMRSMQVANLDELVSYDRLDNFEDTIKYRNTVRRIAAINAILSERGES